MHGRAIASHRWENFAFNLTTSYAFGAWSDGGSTGVYLPNQNAKGNGFSIRCVTDRISIPPNHNTLRIENSSTETGGSIYISTKIINKLIINGTARVIAISEKSIKDSIIGAVISPTHPKI